MANTLTVGTCAGDRSDPVFNVLDQAYDTSVATWEDRFRVGLAFSYVPQLLFEAIDEPVIAEVPGVGITVELSSGKLTTINLRSMLLARSVLPPSPYAVAVFSAYKALSNVLTLPQSSTAVRQVVAGVVLLNDPSANIYNEYFANAGFPCGMLLNKP